ncbi:MAG: hypothetical protein JWP91_2781 [Fibrobacteres bacterium]|nr:hypothetical protein [Fibrobacterota bacterium]
MNLRMPIWAPCALLIANVFAQTATMPAARAHVRMVNGNAVKYTSKLTQVVELNFTFGNGHLPGKQVIDASLGRIAKNYGTGGKDAFIVKKFASSNDGAAIGEIVQFTLADLLSGEVIVTNNISYFPQLQTKNPQEAAAFETAVKTEGRGVLGFHGSGDGGGEWKFYTDELHPVGYHGHLTRTPGPVYKDVALSKHIVLQGVLETGTTLATVPDGVDAVGTEKLATNVKTRQMKNEWYQFGRNLTTDVKYKSLVTPLLKYDPRNLGDALPAQYRYAGGNLYTFLLQVGQGKVSYVPAGHEDDELTLPGTTFDGGTGDYDRYVAQTLFYLAGYKTEVCAGTVCNGLPIVDTKDQLTGQTYQSTTALFDPDKPAFTSLFDKKYEAKVTDVSGRIVDVKRGFGRVTYEFDRSKLKAGIYFLSVKIGSAPAKVRRYAFAPATGA